MHAWHVGAIRFRGLTFQGGMVHGQPSEAGESLEFENCLFRYGFHAQAPYDGTTYQMGSGNYALPLGGNDSRLEGCLIERTAGNAVVVTGDDFVLKNTVIRDVGYGSLGGALSLAGARATVSECSLLNSGSGMLTLRPGSGGSSVTHCEMGHAYRTTVDGGIARFSGDVSGDDGSGSRTVLAFNRIHDCHAPWESGGLYGCTGLYLEGGESRIDVHHNVIWDTTSGSIKFRQLGDVRIVHNTCSDYLNNFTGELVGTLIRNNLFHHAFRVPQDGTVTHNLFLSDGLHFDGTMGPEKVDDNLYASDPGLAGEFGEDERPGTDSPLRDAGVELGDADIQPPVDDGVPDIGAWEYGKADYPGAVGARCPL